MNIQELLKIYNLESFSKKITYTNKIVNTTLNMQKTITPKEITK